MQNKKEFKGINHPDIKKEVEKLKSKIPFLNIDLSALSKEASLIYKKAIELDTLVNEGKEVLSKNLDGINLENDKIWLGAFGEIDGNKISSLSDSEIKRLIYAYMKKERDSWLIHETALAPETHAIINSNSDKITSFDELFLNKIEIQPCVNALITVKHPIIDSNMVFLLGVREKSAIAVWVHILKEKGKIKPIKDDKLLAELLNKKFKNLNIGIEGKTLRSISKTAYNKYHKPLLSLIP